MSDQHASLDLEGALRREWWVVALCVAAALIGAILFAQAAKPEPVTVVTATVGVSPESIPRIQGMVSVEETLRAARGELRDRIKAAGDFTAEEMASLAFAAPGTPQTRILIRSRLSDQARAAKLVETAAKETVAYARESAQGEIDRRKQQIAIAEQALKSIDAVTGATSVERANIAVGRWTIESARLDAQSGLESVQSVYRFDGKTNTETESAASGMRDQLATALLLGLFVGLALAAVREYLVRHPRTRKS